MKSKALKIWGLIVLFVIFMVDQSNLKGFLYRSHPGPVTESLDADTGSADLVDFEPPQVQKFWQQLNLDSSHFEQFADLSRCGQTVQTQRACELALLRMEQACNLNLLKLGNSLFEPSAPWFGIEKIELLQLESQIALVNKDYNQKFNQTLQNCASENHSNAIAAAINGYLSITRDPHTYIIPMRYFDEVLTQSDVRTNSFGLLIKRNQMFDWVVAKVYPGSPAAERGIQIGDIVTHIQGVAAQRFHPRWVQDQLMRSAKLQLGLKSSMDLDAEIRSATLYPRSIHIKNVETLWANEPLGVGLIKIEKFARNTCEDFKSSLQELKSQGLRGLILDLRDNPGGSVDEAACIMDLVTPKGQLLFLTFDQISSIADPYISRRKSLFEGGLAILVNEASASASEIVAGGLKALGRAKVVGQQTFGKGTYQDGLIWTDLPEVAFFETRGFYVFSDGSNAQLTGVIPDIQIQVGSDKKAWLREQDLYAYPLSSKPIDPGNLIGATLAEFSNAKSSGTPLFLGLVDSSSTQEQKCLEYLQFSVDEVQKAVQAVACPALVSQNN